jgi:glycosyltransferase involved in cell wall biosynthesis
VVVANGIQKKSDFSVGFPLFRMKLGLIRLIKLLIDSKPEACILVISHSKPYFFPFLFFLKIIKLKVITWTHGLNLQKKNSKISKLTHYLEHILCDGIILYAEHLKDFIAKSHRNKVFIANNTLNLTEYNPQHINKKNILEKYGINTEKNIIFVGRIQKRKRIQDLLLAFDLLQNSKYGLVIIGPDEEGILSRLKKKNKRIFAIGPLYGTDVLDLLSVCEVFCIPGAIGLSIVDAMYCGLPVVTERVEHGPEIMYLHDGKNGFIVEKGNIQALADRLRLLLEDDQLRLQFSMKAKEEIATKGHIDNLCKGVLRCLDYIINPISI